MNPQVAMLQGLDPSTEQRKALTILMPYISYKESTWQRNISELIKSKFQDHQKIMSIKVNNEKQLDRRDAYEVSKDKKKLKGFK